MDGFIQLHKKICEWEWYTDIPTKTLFLHILLKCNYKEAKWRGKIIKPGEFITSSEHLAMETGLTRQQVRTALKKLENTGEITYQATNDYTILGLNNWATYNQPDNQRITNEQPTNNQRITTTNKEYKEYKENNNTDISNDISSQAIVLLDHRNKGTQRIIDIVKTQVEKEGYIYDNNPQERNRATIIAKRQSDWGTFIKDTPEDQEEEYIRKIIAYSNQKEYTAKIRSCKDFHEKWKKVANSMKEESKEYEKKSYVHPNPLLRF